MDRLDDRKPERHAGHGNLAYEAEVRGENLIVPVMREAGFSESAL